MLPKVFSFLFVFFSFLVFLPLLQYSRHSGTFLGELHLCFFEPYFRIDSLEANLFYSFSLPHLCRLLNHLGVVEINRLRYESGKSKTESCKRGLLLLYEKQSQASSGRQTTAEFYNAITVTSSDPIG